MKVIEKKLFTKPDYPLLADYIADEWSRRKNSESRVCAERDWKEIDRQLRMSPDISHKLDANGRPDRNRAWMPEMELPLQSQTLEVLTADARRMTFPDSGPWFEAHVAMTDEYLERVDFQGLVAGDENEVPSLITQDNADKLVHGILDFWHRQYDFAGNVDLINAEAFKYGSGIGRARLVKKQVFINKAQGMVSTEIPVLFPVSIKNTYPDDRKFALMNEGHILGPSMIFWKKQNIHDLKLAATKGSKDPNNENGGWIPEHLEGMSGDDRDHVDILEYEGDIIVPRKTVDSMFVPNVMITVVIGRSGKDAVTKVIRVRKRRNALSSYIEFPYHREHIGSAYSTSPLIKGWPIQKCAVEALNRLIMSAALNTEPPIGYNRDDPYFVANGGPVIFPGAQWATTDDIKTHQIGDPTALFAVYTGILNQYYDVTGVNAPRLGAQTVSHTTAYAKEAELNRGVVRTVDYVRSTLKGPMTQWLNMAYTIGRESMGRTLVYLQAYNGYVEIEKDHLPDFVTFDAHGSGGPQEEQAKLTNKLNAIQQATAIEQLRAQAQQLGITPHMDYEAVIDEILREGGWTDVDAITNSGTEGSIAGVESQAGMAADSSANFAPGAAIQSLYGR